MGLRVVRLSIDMAPGYCAIQRLHADPELSVPRLARILGTNSAYVLRAFNEGLGQNFSAFVNRLPCEDVAPRLRNGASGDLLDLALECGFSPKASFNLAVQAVFELPNDW